jgi:hypothetical protein
MVDTADVDLACRDVYEQLQLRKYDGLSTLARDGKYLALPSTSVFTCPFSKSHPPILIYSHTSNQVVITIYRL